jgi:hypothetical protein
VHTFVGTIHPSLLFCGSFFPLFCGLYPLPLVVRSVLSSDKFKKIIKNWAKNERFRFEKKKIA